MIIIEASETLEILTDATAATTEPSWVVGLVQAAGATFEQASSETGATNGTTAVSMVTGTASKQKRIMSLSVFNRDTVTRIVTIRYSSTLPIFRTSLLPNWSLQYSDAGWSVHDTSGMAQTVGTPGTNGTNGTNGALTVTEVEIDFTNTPTREKSFTIIDAGVSSSSKIIVCQSGKAATGQDADENEVTVLAMNAVPGTGQFTLNTFCLNGHAGGKFKVNYQFS